MQQASASNNQRSKQQSANNMQQKATCNAQQLMASGKQHATHTTASTVQHAQQATCNTQAKGNKQRSASITRRAARAESNRQQPTNIRQQLTTHMWNAMLDNFFDCCQAATDAVLSPAREQNAIGSAAVCCCAVVCFCLLLCCLLLRCAGVSHVGAGKLPRGAKEYSPAPVGLSWPHPCWLSLLLTQAVGKGRRQGVRCRGVLCAEPWSTPQLLLYSPASPARGPRNLAEKRVRSRGKCAPLTDALSAGMLLLYSPASPARGPRNLAEKRVRSRGKCARSRGVLPSSSYIPQLCPPTH